MNPKYDVMLKTRDQQNRLVKALLGTHESDYFYDGESRRVRIKELESGTQTKDETFVWCGSRICQKRSGSTVERNYLAEGFQEGTSDYFYTRDHLGSVREVVGGDGITVSGRVAYSAWGEATETGSVLSDFGFTGHYVDRRTGLNLALYRSYSPSLGRWMSRDPIGITGGFNLYGYVLNDPAEHIDPDGRRRECMPGDNCGAGPYPGPSDPTPAPEPPDPDPSRPPTPGHCTPCLQPPLPRYDQVPPSKPHFPCKGSHIHMFKTNQNPVTCVCNVSSDVICLDSPAPACQ